QVYAHPQHADALARVYEETTRLSAFEPGVIYYCICLESQRKSSGEREEKDEERASGGSKVFHFFERYTGSEAFQAHNPHPKLRTSDTVPSTRESYLVILDTITRFVRKQKRRSYQPDPGNR
ncbi:hypothetical protein QBC32DRAFT_224442, partial [Pseudoneurospora amorphoporcata]